MNYLIICQNFFPFVEPTAKIVKKLVDDNNFKDDKFFVVSKGRKSESFSNDRVINYVLEDYQNRSIKKEFSLKVFLFKINCRLKSIFIPRDLLDWRRSYKIAKRVLKENRIDCIISVSGWFSAQLVGSKLSRRYTIPLVSWYTDPFLFNVGKTKYNHNILKLIENSWLMQASLVFMPRNYYESYLCIKRSVNSKLLPIELPCFFSDSEVRQILSHRTEKNILHNGAFMEHYREPKKIFDIAREMQNRFDYKFVSLGNLNRKLIKKYERKIPSNFLFFDRKEGTQLLGELGKAAILVVIDNQSGIQIPSKAFEYVSTGKPILLIYSNTMSETKKFLSGYPRLVAIHEDEQDIDNVISNILSCISSIEINDLKMFLEGNYPTYRNEYIFSRMKNELLKLRI